MRPEDRDLSYLWDIRDAAQSITRFTQSLTLESFVADELVRYAVERQLILIGEAARRVSAEFKASHTELPWRQMIAQRNLLIHEYGEISAELVWQTATVDLPHLVIQLGKFLEDKAS